jgi:hypothetical protein
MARIPWCRALIKGGLYAGVLLTLMGVHSAAFAAIWGFVDDKGTAHFSSERVDERYELFSLSSAPQEPIPLDLPIGLPLAPLSMPMTMSVAGAKLTSFFEGSVSFKIAKPHLIEASRTHNIDFELLQALVATESGFNALAISPKGAIGLMQVMPDTAARFGLSAEPRVPIQRKLADPALNIKTGARYLSYLMNLFPGRLDLVLASYNAGEGAVQRAGNNIPNFKETQNYVQTVMQLYQVLKPPVVQPLKVPPPQHLPNVQLAQPKRLNPEVPGGAAKRGNMVMPLQLASPPFTPISDSEQTP